MVALFFPVTGLVQSFGERFGVPEVVLLLGFSLPFVTAFGALVLLAFYPERAHAFALLVVRPLPDRVKSMADSLTGMLLQGLEPLRDPRKLAVLFVLSIPIWLTEAAVFWIMAFPFGIHETHTDLWEMAANMVLVTSITNIGSSVPAAPGGLGLFEIIARETLVLSPLTTVGRPEAAGFAVVVHAVILLPMIILGQVFLWTAQVSLRRLSREGQREESQPAKPEGRGR